MIPPASLAGVHVYFPDPWPKKRHHKRRLLQPAFVHALAQRLAPGGYLHAATDWDEYAQEILATCAAEPLLANTVAEFAPRPAWRPLTKFETRGLQAGPRRARRHLPPPLSAAPEARSGGLLRHSVAARQRDEPRDRAARDIARKMLADVVASAGSELLPQRFVVVGAHDLGRERLPDRRRRARRRRASSACPRSRASSRSPAGRSSSRG